MEELIEKLSEGETIEIHENRLPALQNELDMTYRRSGVNLKAKEGFFIVTPISPATWLKKNI